MLTLLGLLLLLVEKFDGTDCSLICPSNCKTPTENRTETCNYTTGECLHDCKLGYAGPNCTVECPHMCATSSANGVEICNATSEECFFGCKNGTYGARCEKNCSNFDRNCKRCSSKDNISVVCDECNMNFYRSNGKCLACNYWCALNISSSFQACRKDDGYCNFGCKSGRYGYTCGVRCSSTCRDTCDRDNDPINNICDRSNDSCTYGCENDNFFGSQCEQFCYRMVYEQASGNCKRGSCKTGCKFTSYCGPTCESACNDGCVSLQCNQSCTCSKGCIRTKWGEKCDKQCNDNCNEPFDFSSNVCNRYNGSCPYGCHNDNFWGSQCEQSCSSDCTGTVCEQASGNCTRGCNSKEVYGERCDMPCNENCVNGTCARADGYCDSGCISGSYGDRCHLKCNVNCLNLSCKRSNGYCNDGCEAGRYGDQCNRQCSIRCLNLLCHREDGNCTLSLDDLIGKSDSEHRDVSDTTTLNSLLIGGLVSGWVFFFVVIAVLAVKAIKRYKIGKVSNDQKIAEDEQQDKSNSGQHEYMSLQHGPGYSNQAANYEDLNQAEDGTEALSSGSSYVNVEQEQL